MLWLLSNGASAYLITWFMPRDAWLIDRKNAQPTQAFFNDSIGSKANQFEAIAQSTSQADMFLKLEEKGVFFRIDKNVLSTMFHGATADVYLRGICASSEAFHTHSSGQSITLLSKLYYETTKRP